MAVKRNIQINKLSIGDSEMANRLIGSKLNRLTVLYYPGDRVFEKGNRQPMVIAQCECGHIGLYVASKINSGWSKSCGCLQAELSVKMHTQHGNKTGEKPRGTKAYSLWRAMLDRCRNGVKYIERDISVCDEWKEFIPFFRDMGNPPTKEHTLDRIDNNKGYFNGNCRWATRIEQANNTSRNKYVFIDGEKLSLAQAMRKLNCGRTKIKRIYNEQKKIA